MGGANVDLGADLPAIPGVVDLVLIGSGGSGLVYRGRQEAFARDVAVKILAAPPATPAALQRWQRELEAMGRLSNHPNIVAVFDSGLTQDGRPYLVMPFIPGGSLGDRVRNAGRLTADEAVGVGVKIASALTAAHEAGVLHRDVKPDNVLLSPYEPQLADFGIARLVDAATTAVTAVGQIHATINYAAPEVLAGEPATEASDVYGLGATLYTALRGEVPFPHAADANVVAVAHQIIHAPTPELGNDVPFAVADAIAQAMAKDPADRPQSAAAFAELLERAHIAAPTTSLTSASPTVRVNQIPTTTMRPPTSEAPPRRITARGPARGGRRVPQGVAFMGLAVAAAALLLVLMLMSNDDDGGDTASSAATTLPVASGDASRAAGSDNTDVSETGRRYFTLLSRGDYGGAYAMLSPAFQELQSQASFESFWRSVSPVRITGTVTASGLRVTVPITMGSRPNSYVLTLARGEGNRLYVDGPRPR